MFTREQIQTASQKVKTGADYPKLVQELKELKVLMYDHYVADGSTVYYGANKHAVIIGHDQAPILINNISSADKLKHTIKIHQEGKTDYQTFCIQAGEAGVEKWVSDLTKMTVTYLDKTGKELVIEAIPKGDY